MRYFINFDKTINQLTPSYIGGRKLILFMQSLAFPLRSLNDDFVNWAKETRIEASMTSQIFKFEWYLNRKFSKYFLNQSHKISITNVSPTGVPIYAENASIPDSDNMLLHLEEEGVTDHPMYFQNERTQSNSYSFIVHSPAIDTSLISTDAYRSMLSYYVDKYKLANKTYIITFNS